jgi:Rrf2 family protein
MQMQISRRVDYALRAIGFLAAQPEGKITHLSEIAEAGRIPSRFLEKIMRPLVNHGYVKAYLGPKGGYAIARGPDSITFKEVIESVEGPIAVNECIPFSEVCTQSSQCYQMPIWRKLQGAIEETLSRHTIGELIRQAAGWPNGQEPGQRAEFSSPSFVEGGEGLKAPGPEFSRARAKDLGEPPLGSEAKTKAAPQGGCVEA